MVGKFLHHVSLVSRNIEVSAMFYRDVLELAEVKRPDFPIAGRWFRSNGVEVHLIDKSDGTFRQSKSIDHNDVHFAIRVPHFEEEITRLMQLGYTDESYGGGEKQLRINRHGKAGYPQVFIVDPDNHVIEINSEKL